LRTQAPAVVLIPALHQRHAYQRTDAKWGVKVGRIREFFLTVVCLPCRALVETLMKNRKLLRALREKFKAQQGEGRISPEQVNIITGALDEIAHAISTGDNPAVEKAVGRLAAAFIASLELSEDDNDENT